MNIIVTIDLDKLERNDRQAQAATMLQQAAEKVAEHGFGDHAIFADSGHKVGTVKLGLGYGQSRVDHLLDEMHKKNKSFGKIKAIDHIEGVVLAVVNTYGERKLQKYRFTIEKDILHYRGMKEQV